jgi:anti-anti-sigma regulatory factor
MTTISSMASPTGRVLVVAPHGSLTVDDCASLRDALRVTTGELDLLVVDLLDVEEIDDAVVEVLVGAAARCRTAGVRFIVANADTDPWTSLTKARLAGVLKMHRRGSTPLSELLQLLEL